MAAQADKKLRKALTAWDLMGLSMGGIIGSGWLFGVNKAVFTTGPSAILSWIVGGILVLFVALAWAEISSMMPRSGAIVRYPFWSHGSYTGFTFGWAYFLTAVTVPPIEAEATLFGIASISSGYTHALTTTGLFLGSQIEELNSLGIFFGVLLMIGFFFLNYAGVRIFGKTNTAVTVWKIAIPIITFLTLFTLFKSTNFSFPPLSGAPSGSSSFFPLGPAAAFFAIPASGVFFAYLGFRQGLEYGGEAKRPQRDIPLATVGAVLLAMLIYVLLQVAYIGSINWSNAGVTPGNWAALSTSPWATLPLKYAVASGVGAGYAFFAAVLIFDSWLSPAGTGWIYLGTSTRTLYGLSVEGYFPRGLHSIHERFRIPWVALIVSVILGIVFLAPLPSWYALVGFISSTSALTYVTGGAVVPTFRKYAATLKRPFRLPAPWIFSALSFIAAALVLYWSGFTVITWVLLAVWIGLGLYLLYAGPAKMGMSRGAGVGLAVVTFAVLAFLAYFGPLYAQGETTPHTFLWSTKNALSDVLYFVIYAVLTIGMTLAIWRLVKPEFRKHIGAGIWIPVWLLAYYVLSYFGEFGAAGLPGGVLLPFPDGTIIAIVVAAVFFAWAAMSGFETEEIKAIVAEGGVVRVEEEEEAKFPLPEPTGVPPTG
jgi:amino acid transporter